MSNEVVKKPARAASTATIGKKIDKLSELRAKKSELEKAVAGVEGEIKDLESVIMEDLEKSDTDRASSKSGMVSVKSAVVAQVIDWDAFYAYIYKNKFGHLLQRRVSEPAWRELQEQGKKVPGTEPFSRKKLHFTAAK